MSSSSFESLRDLHDSVNNLLRSPDIKQVLSIHKQDQKWVQKVSESSLKMLDSCGTTKEILGLVKSHIQQLQSTFRRAALGTETEKKLSAFHFQRKELRKQMFKRLNSLKKMKSSTEDTPIDDNLMVVANVLKEVRETIVTLLESIMLLMSMPNPNPNPKTTTKMMVSCNGVFAAKVKFMRVNSLTPWEACEVEALQNAIERLEAVESAMEDLEVELGCIFKRLMRTRVLLLNILTN